VIRRIRYQVYVRTKHEKGRSQESGGQLPELDSANASVNGDAPEIEEGAMISWANFISLFGKPLE
jgi:hypothetical protein